MGTLAALAMVLLLSFLSSACGFASPGGGIPPFPEEQMLLHGVFLKQPLD